MFSFYKVVEAVERLEEIKLDPRDAAEMRYRIKMNKELRKDPRFKKSVIDMNKRHAKFFHAISKDLKGSVK